MAPFLLTLLGSLVSNNLPQVAQAVVDKGLGYVEDKLGIKIDPTGEGKLTPDQILQIRLAATKHEEFKIQQEYANISDARKMNSDVQTSSVASPLAKNAAYFIDFAIIAATLIISYCAFYVGIPEGNKEVVYTVLGSLYTLTGTIINFHRGTSVSSQNKDNIVGAIAKSTIK